MLAPLVSMSTGTYRTPGISMLEGETTCSFVVPTYNEALRLPDSIESLLALASRSTEVIFVDDGSTDATPELLESATHGRFNIRVIRHTRNRGKGAVVRDGVFAARGETIVFMDADLSTDLRDLTTLRRALEFCDVAIGSRACDSSVVEYLDYRARMGRIFNAFARGVSGLPFRDTQCGFKGFQAPVAKLLFALSGMNGFAFDVEILAYAQRLGLNVEEIPVRWKHVDGSHIRPFSDPARMTTDLVAGRMAHRRNDTIAVLTVDSTAGLGEDAVRSCVRANDVVVHGESAVHVVLGHLCPVDLRHLIADRLRDALDCRVDSTRLSTSRLIEMLAHRTRPVVAPSDPGLPQIALAGVGS